MTKKKSILSLVLAVCLMICATIMFSACSSKPISEKGKTYVVQNKQTDITFNWGDDKNDIFSFYGNESGIKDVLSIIKVVFKEDYQVNVIISGNGDGYMYYVINEENCLEFYDSLEDYRNRTERITDDYLGFEYKFSGDRRTITITASLSDEDFTGNKSFATIKLTVGK